MYILKFPLEVATSCYGGQTLMFLQWSSSDQMLSENGMINFSESIFCIYSGLHFIFDIIYFHVSILFFFNFFY